MTTINDLKILLPQLRKITPSLIASEIVGVQPMTGPAGQIFSMRHGFGEKRPFIVSIGEWDNIIGTEFGYYVVTSISSLNENNDKLIEAECWCIDHCEDEYLVVSSDGFYKFYFKKEKHRTMFIMRFGE